jgi:hypothetical protein
MRMKVEFEIRAGLGTLLKRGSVERGMSWTKIEMGGAKK